MTSNPAIEEAARLNERITRHNHVHRDAALVTCDIQHCGTHGWTQGTVPLAAKVGKPDPLFDEAHELWASLDQDQKDLLALWEHSRTTHGKHTGQCHPDLLPMCARIRDKVQRCMAINDELAAKYPNEMDDGIAYNFKLARNVCNNLTSLVNAIHTH